MALTEQQISELNIANTRVEAARTAGENLDNFATDIKNIDFAKTKGFVPEVKAAPVVENKPVDNQPAVDPAPVVDPPQPSNKPVAPIAPKVQPSQPAAQAKTQAAIDQEQANAASIQETAMTDQDRKSEGIKELVSSGRTFNETDAKNFAFSQRDTNFKKFIGGVGGQVNPLYIGSTNFKQLQETYTPYQIDQATVRTKDGIFWKSDVNIAEVPRVDPVDEINDDNNLLSGMVSKAKGEADKTVSDKVKDKKEEKTEEQNKLQNLIDELGSTPEIDGVKEDLIDKQFKLDEFDQQLEELESDIRKEVEGEASDSYISALAIIRGQKILKAKRSVQRDFDRSLSRLTLLKEEAQFARTEADKNDLEERQDEQIEFTRLAAGFERITAEEALLLDPEDIIKIGDKIYKRPDEDGDGGVDVSDAQKAKLIQDFMGQGFSFEEAVVKSNSVVAAVPLITGSEATGSKAEAPTDTTEGFTGGEWNTSGCPPEGCRTDRHNNPAAFTTDIAEQAGLVEGVDYERGDAFPDNPDMFTANLLGNGIDKTIDVIDNIGFFTQDGNQRWAHTAIADEVWHAMDDQQKEDTVKLMNQREGGSGTIFDESPAEANEPQKFRELTPNDASKLNKEVLKDPSFMAINSAKDSWDMLDAYDKLFKKHGNQRFGKEAQQLRTAYNQLLLNLKEFFNLGVLNGPDLELMEKIIPNPNINVLLDPIDFISAGGEAGMQAGIDQAKEMIKTQITDRAKDVSDAYGEFNPEQIGSLKTAQDSFNDVITAIEASGGGEVEDKTAFQLYQDEVNNNK